MKTSKKGIELIKKFEGCELNAYPDPGTGDAPWTIGYGNTYYANGKKVKKGDKITKIQAEELLLMLLPKYESIIAKNVKATLSQNQFDALVSFCWNTGGSHDLFKMINEQKTNQEIYAWYTTHYIKSGGKEMPGLIKRRKIEADLFILS